MPGSRSLVQAALDARYNGRAAVDALAPEPAPEPPMASVLDVVAAAPQPPAQPENSEP